MLAHGRLVLLGGAQRVIFCPWTSKMRLHPKLLAGIGVFIAHAQNELAGKRSMPTKVSGNPVACIAAPAGGHTASQVC